ncbi:MAG: AMP-binding protein [Oscillospiraceae bacterium]|nr:AMP-binding protein [Oscillospiraceae bacterium]
MMLIEEVHQQYVEEEFDETGVIKRFELHLPESFNYAYDIIDKLAEIEPDRRGLLWCNEHGDERALSYGELSRLSNRTANMLLALGLKKGDKVMTVLKRHWQMWVVIFALEKIGAILVPATNQLKKKDYVYRFNAGDIHAVIATCEGDVCENIELAAEECDITLMLCANGCRDGWISFDREMEKHPDVMERIPNSVDDDSLMFFSSGTTAYPKMIMHSHRYGMSHLPTAKHWQNLNKDSLHLTISESGWGKFFWGKVYGQMALGCTIMSYDFTRFVPSDVLGVIEKYKVTSLCCPPTMYRFFIKEGMEGYDISSLQYATTAGEALNAEVYNRFKEYTGLSLMEGFGQTESVLLIGNPVGSESRSGSMGRAMPMFDVIVADTEGNEVPTGITGEICIKLKPGVNNGILKCYYKNDEENERAFAYGLYHTGDTAYKDEDGYFWYVGRIDDIIKSSGYRVGPFEIESILMEHPAVLEVAVTAVPDPIRGQIVKATVVLTAGYRDRGNEDLKKELQEYVKTNTAPYKYPRIVEFADELPKTISGKIRRAEIRETDRALQEAGK